MPDRIGAVNVGAEPDGVDRDDGLVQLLRAGRRGTGRGVVGMDYQPGSGWQRAAGA